MINQLFLAIFTSYYFPGFKSISYLPGGDICISTPQALCTLINITINRVFQFDNEQQRASFTVGA